MPARYAYLITRPHDDSPDGRRVMSRGIHDLTDGETLAEAAADLLRENRTLHSYYKGPRRCSMWPAGDGAVPRTAPEAAEHYDD